MPFYDEGAIDYGNLLIRTMKESILFLVVPVLIWWLTKGPLKCKIGKPAYSA